MSAETQRMAETAINGLGLGEVMARYRAASKRFMETGSDENREVLWRIGEEIADALDGAARFGEIYYGWGRTNAPMERLS